MMTRTNGPGDPYLDGTGVSKRWYGYGSVRVPVPPVPPVPVWVPVPSSQLCLEVNWCSGYFGPVHQSAAVLKTSPEPGCEVGEIPGVLLGFLVARVGEIDAISSSR